jgi:hypothetical protein
MRLQTPYVSSRTRNGRRHLIFANSLGKMQPPAETSAMHLIYWLPKWCVPELRMLRSSERPRSAAIPHIT